MLATPSSNGPTSTRPRHWLRGLAMLGSILFATTSCTTANYVELDDFTADVKVQFDDVGSIEERISDVPVWRKSRVARLARMFRAVGCMPPNLRAQYVTGSKMPNVICTLPGKTDKKIVVATHHAAPRGSVGFFDAWTGVAMLPTLYKSLKGVQREHTYEFVAFTYSPNKGDASYLYLREDPAARKKVSAMIWLDFLGLGDLRAWSTRTDPNLWADLNSVGSALGFDVASANLSNAGDLHDHSRAFRWASIPTAYLHSLDVKSQRVLGSTLQDLNSESLDIDAYLRSYRVLAVYLGYIDRTLKARKL